MAYAWDRKIRAYKMDAERGRVIDEFTIRDMVKEPNRFQVEAIIQACCMVMNQVIELEDARTQGLQQTLQKLKG